MDREHREVNLPVNVGMYEQDDYFNNLRVLMEDLGLNARDARKRLRNMERDARRELLDVAQFQDFGGDETES